MLSLLSGAILLGLTALLAVTAYRLIFSTFDTPDDEGYLIVTLRSFADGNALYDSVYTQYGPGFYTVIGGAMKVFGVAFTSDGARWVNLALWLGSTLLAGVALFRLTRNLAIAAAGLGISFLVLVSDAAEPLHPGATIGFVLTAIAAALTLSERHRRAQMALLGGLVVLLLTTKVNVGALALISMLFAFSVTGRDFASLRVVRWLIGGLIVVVPFALAGAHLDNDNTVRFAATVASGALALVIATIGAKREELPGWRELIWFAGAGGATLAFVCLVPVLLGTSPGGLIDGWLIRPLDHASAAFNEVTLSNAGLVWSALGIIGAAAFVSLPRRYFESSGFALVRLAIGAGMWITLAGAILGAPEDLPRAVAFATPFAWVITIAPGQESPEWRFRRVALASLAVLQPLHAYPVPGNQLSWATLLFVFVGALCIADAITYLRAASAPRLPAWAAITVGTVAVLAFATWFALDRLRPLAEAADSQYSSSVPLDLPGAELQRTDLPRAENLRALTAGIERDCDTFITLPGLNSLYLYTGLEPPEEMSSSWMLYLSVEEQEDIVDAIADQPRLCAVIKPDLLEFWRLYEPRYEIPDRPLVRYIEDEFRVIHDYSGYQLAVRR